VFYLEHNPLQMKKYWQSLDEYRQIPDKHAVRFEKEDKNQILDLLENDPSGIRSSRRDFLKVFGFSLTSAALAASCERPVQKAIPYLIHPESIVPGVALHYATTYYDGRDFSHILVKTRDGRPIKIEGNALSAHNGGGTTARVQASVLSLYDDARIKTPLFTGAPVRWETIDSEIIKKLAEAQNTGKSIVLVTPPVVSPSTRRLINDFSLIYKGFKWLEYREVSLSGMAEASLLCYGITKVPSLNIEKADVLVSFGADFLGSWIAPERMIPAYASRRKPGQQDKGMLRHIQFESVLSLTGSNADLRVQIKPSEEKVYLANLYNQLAVRAGKQGITAPSVNYNLSAIASELFESRGRSLVVCGSNDTQSQILVHAINDMLGNTGITVDFDKPLQIIGGSDKEFSELVGSMNRGEVGVLLLAGVNPVYDYPGSSSFLSGMEKTGCCVCMVSAPDETCAKANHVLPVSHYLESWDDAEIEPGELSLTQPCIHTMFDTRCMQDNLLQWMGSELSYKEYLQNNWKERYYANQGTFEDFWKESLKNGVRYYSAGKGSAKVFANSALTGLTFAAPEQGGGLELVLYESVQIGSGRPSNNPWLQELPDPVTKLSWENALLVNPSDAANLGLVNGDVVKIPGMFEVPVLLQAGQAGGTCGLALGYGHTAGGKVAEHCGVNAYRLVSMVDGQRLYYKSGLRFEKTGKNQVLALTQTHNSMEGRPIVRETNLQEYLKKPDAGNELHAKHESHHKTLYPEVDFDGFHWGLSVDLSACVGCNSCVISCQAENNIPVVGKEEVFRRRIMHWIKIDRYYADDPSDPKVSFQPIMCQHCDNAPCENVCPVSATNHSSEGLNQMSYNRCIGTKYCINNCPYRVRRFNWYQYTGNKVFDFNTSNDLGRMVLNPDVTVRDRGVVEKCSFCAQRIQEKKLQAKLENRALKDGEIQPACVQACPAGALIFGNLKDKGSKVSVQFDDPRNYHLLEELHTLPSVGYLTKVRNGKEEDKA
jgi:molybdopterin-containing oxidoreductase family iron-sulfur binding subunit